jgi:hypothetical protein
MRMRNLLRGIVAVAILLLAAPSAFAAQWSQVSNVDGGCGPTIDVDSFSDGIQSVDVSGGNGTLWILENDGTQDDVPYYYSNGAYHSSLETGVEDIYVPKNTTNPWVADRNQGTVAYYDGSSWHGPPGSVWHTIGVSTDGTTNYGWSNGNYNSSSCTSGPSVPHGYCFWYTTGSSWTQDVDKGGGYQITGDGASTSTSEVYAVDSSYNVWWRRKSHVFPYIEFWTALGTSICNGGGSFTTSGIAVYGGNVLAMRASDHNVYEYFGGSSSCWSLLSSSNNQMYSLGFDNSGGTLYGVHSDGCLWEWSTTFSPTR